MSKSPSPKKIGRISLFFFTINHIYLIHFETLFKGWLRVSNCSTNFWEEAFIILQKTAQCLIRQTNYSFLIKCFYVFKKDYSMLIKTIIHFYPKKKTYYSLCTVCTICLQKLSKPTWRTLCPIRETHP